MSAATETPCAAAARRIRRSSSAVTRAASRRCRCRRSDPWRLRRASTTSVATSVGCPILPRPIRRHADPPARYIRASLSRSRHPGANPRPDRPGKVAHHGEGLAVSLDKPERSGRIPRPRRLPDGSADPRLVQGAWHGRLPALQAVRRPGLIDLLSEDARPVDRRYCRPLPLHDAYGWEEPLGDLDAGQPGGHQHQQVISRLVIRTALPRHQPARRPCLGRAGGWPRCPRRRGAYAVVDPMASRSGPGDTRSYQLLRPVAP